MKKRILILALAGSLLLSGCTSLLERSYSVVEPYADRYWDASAEDTLRAESYQDLVNSLLLLVEERSEDGVIRYYTSGDAYSLAFQATYEVKEDTMLGSYLLEDVTFTYQAVEEGSCTLTYTLTYRQDAEDVESLMVLSDSQSLVDLLRLAVREDHDRLTARFAYDMPRQDVETAVQSVWREVCLGDAAEAAGTEAPAAEETEMEGSSQEEMQSSSENTAQDIAQEPPEELLTEGTQPVSGTESGEMVELPPCPWEIRYYPDQDAAELVEVLLKH